MTIIHAFDRISHHLWGSPVLELESLTVKQLTVEAELAKKTPKDLLFLECQQQTGLSLDRRQTLENLIETAATAAKRKSKGDKSGLERLEHAKKISHVKNTKTGLVFPATTLLLGQPHLVPWDMEHDCPMDFSSRAAA